uniref:60S ribosomal protein L7 2-like n=1 Tax=Dermatophagoides pteronyssinus TaxID=6956 RepID=A0A6P6YJL4_DERPT
EAALATRERAAAERTQLMLRRFEEYEAEYAQRAAAEAAARAQCGPTTFFRPAEPQVLLVVRLKGVNKLCPRVRKVFQLFRLLQLHNAVFLKVNTATRQMLKFIEPFVAFGAPNLATVRALVYKRGYLRLGPAGAYSRVAICDNAQIEERLGRFDVRGVEDIVHTLYTCGPHFKEVNKALWTFKLHAPRGGFACKRHGFAEFRKGTWGDHEDLINVLVQRML